MRNKINGQNTKMKSLNQNKDRISSKIDCIRVNKLEMI